MGPWLGVGGLWGRHWVIGVGIRGALVGCGGLWGRQWVIGVGKLPTPMGGSLPQCCGRALERLAAARAPGVCSRSAAASFRGRDWWGKCGRGSVASPRTCWSGLVRPGRPGPECASCGADLLARPRSPRSPGTGVRRGPAGPASFAPVVRARSAPRAAPVCRPGFAPVARAQAPPAGQRSPEKSAAPSTLPARRMRHSELNARPAARAMPTPRSTQEVPTKTRAIAARTGTSSVKAWVM